VANPTLTEFQQRNLLRPLLARTIERLEKLSAGNKHLKWALRRKLAKELVYLERGTPAERRKLKLLKRAQQKGKCALCGKRLPLKGAELDRFQAYNGYTEKNTRLVHHECHIRAQLNKGYS